MGRIDLIRVRCDHRDHVLWGLCASSRDHGSWGHHDANEIAAQLSVLSEMVDTAERILQDCRMGSRGWMMRGSAGTAGIGCIVGECARGFVVRVTVCYQRLEYLEKSEL